LAPEQRIGQEETAYERVEEGNRLEFEKLESIKKRLTSGLVVSHHSPERII
jgi:hypothetical protein